MADVITINVIENPTPVTITTTTVAGSYTMANIDHTLIQNIGTNTHAQIDTFISTNQPIIDLVLENRIPITQANVSTILGGALDSTKDYFIDGVISLDGLGANIEIPQGGLEIQGYSFDTSKITCSDASYTLFTSPVGGSGNLICRGFSIEITGASSQVYNIVSDTGDEAIELDSVNYNNCTSLGIIDNYRQGLEQNTGRFGGKPELTLKGIWTGGYLITTSIVRGLVDGSYTLYKAGTGFAMASRFLSNQNIDLPANVCLLDFSASNFANPSTLQLVSGILTRNGVFDPNDSNITPNIDSTNLSCSWRNNQGLNNTHVGGEVDVTTEVTTIITTPGVFVDLAGTTTASDLQHFDSPASGQLRHLGNSPREFTLTAEYTLDAGANDEVDLKVVVWDNSASAFVDGKTERRVINNLQGGRDVGFFTLISHINLDKNDYVKIQVSNSADTTNITAELDSILMIIER